MGAPGAKPGRNVTVIVRQAGLWRKERGAGREPLRERNRLSPESLCSLSRSLPAPVLGPSLLLGTPLCSISGLCAAPWGSESSREWQAGRGREQGRDTSQRHPASNPGMHGDPTCPAAANVREAWAAASRVSTAHRDGSDKGEARALQGNCAWQSICLMYKYSPSAQTRPPTGVHVLSPHKHTPHRCRHAGGLGLTREFGGA